MTELVTINAAREAQQLAILAQRPGATPGEHKQHNAIQITQAGVQPDARRAAQGAEAGAQGNSQQDPSRNNDRSDAGLTGPSRPVVQLAAFDSGSEKTRPTVTPDLFPSAPAPTGKSSVGPANSLATSPIVNGQTQAEVDVAIAQRALQTPAFEKLASTDSGRNIRLEAAARAVRADASIAVFGYAPTPNQSPEAELQKFSDKAAAAQGTFSGEAPVDKKFYGQGVEAVVGQFAGPEQPQKYADKAAATDTPPSFEDGSGQVKYHDKVAQTDTGFAGGQQQDQQKSYYDRAQDAANAAAASTEPIKARPEVSLYGATPPPTPSAPATPVQVTV